MAQAFSYEFYENFKNNFFNRTSLVFASGIQYKGRIFPLSLSLSLHYSLSTTPFQVNVSFLYTPKT